MSAAASLMHNGKYRRISHLIVLVVLTVATGLCLGEQSQTRPAPGRRRNPPSRLIQLPPPNTTGVLALEQALLRQNLPGVMGSQPLGVTEIGQLLWATATGSPLAASTGEATLVLYVVGTDGVYRYVPNGHYLEQVSPQAVLGAMQMTVLPQQAAAGCGILMTQSSATRPGRSDTPGRRAMLLETGQRIQNLRLEASALGLSMSIPQQFDGPGLVRGLNLPRNTEILFALFVGYRSGQMTSSLPSPLTGPAQTQPTKRAALVVGQNGFMDEELFETNRVLSTAGIQTVLVSQAAGPVTGVQGGTAQAAVALDALKIDEVDAVVFIGGPGASTYVASPAAMTLARDANSKQKILAAISTAPAVLASAGVVNGRRVTAAETEREALVKAGAVFVGEDPVERDGLLITASGPSAAGLFGQAIATALQGG
jgi:protease I